MALLTHHSRRSTAILAVSVLALVLAFTWSAKRILNPAVRVLGAGHAAGAPAAPSRMASAYGKLPISFEINQGQADHSVQYLARGSGYSLFLTPGEAVLALHSAHRNSDRSTAHPRPDLRSATDAQISYSTSVVRVRLIGANASASVAGLEPLPGKSNYFIGNDPAKWHTDVPTYAKVRYSGIYPGIDLIYYGNQEGRLEHDFVVAPGADPNTIAMDFNGSADSLTQNLDGDLVLRTKSGDLSIERPIVYQMINARKKSVEAAYTLTADNKVAFKLGDYDKRAPLVIDPVIQYSAVFGGSGDDYAWSIAIDSSRNAYVTGLTFSVDLPLAHPFQDSWTGVGRGSFVAKINAAGTALLYSTYLAGIPIEQDGFGTEARGIAVDSTGHAYVTGYSGPGLPVKNAYQSDWVGPYSSAFLTVFNPTGDNLIYSTYLGTGGGSYALGIAVDSPGNAYITGWGNVPTLHSILGAGSAFVAKFSNIGALQYSSIVAPPAVGSVAIAVDASGSAYITGSTYNPNLPVTKNAFQSKCPSCGQTYSGFVMKISPTGDSRVYSTYLGGVSPALTNGTAIAVDTSGNAYIGGSTDRAFPVTTNAFQRTFGGVVDGFITKLNPTGTGLIYSTYLGGDDVDVIYGLALDQYRQVYALGWGGSSNFPLKAPLQGYVYPNRGQKFVTTLSATGSSLVYYSTYFGKPGGTWDVGGIAVDKALNVYIAAGTDGNIPLTSGALNKPGKGVDVFISKLVIMDDLAVGVSASPSPVAHGGNLTYTIAATSKGPDFATNLRVDDVLPAGTTFVSASASGGTCTAPAVGETGKLHCVLKQQEKGQTYTIHLTVHVNAPSGTRISNTAAAVSNTQDFLPGNNKGTIVTAVN